MNSHARKPRMEDTPATNIGGDAHQEMIAAFSEITSATKEEASFFLESHNYDLDSAVSTFFEKALGLRLLMRIALAFVGSRGAGDSSPWDLRLQAMVV